MSNYHIELAGIEVKIAGLQAEGHRHDSPQIRALQNRRSQIAASGPPNVATMSLPELEAELEELRSYTGSCKSNPVLCDATWEMFKRRKLALKDAIALHQRQPIELEQSEAA